VTPQIAEKVNKPIGDCDLIIVSGPEHLRKWIQYFYPQWDKFKAPKVAWYHESFVREDYTLDYADYENMFDFHFFPDKTDAEKFKGDWLPLGVDTHMFEPGFIAKNYVHERDISVGFIGLMYPKRARFVEELTPHLGDIKIDYRTACQSERGLIPAIGVWDFDGLNIRRSMQLLAETYRRIKVFVTFPSLSNVLVAKVLESMACGCRLVAPKQPLPLNDSYLPYQGAYQCAEQIRAAMEAGPVPGGITKYVHAAHCMENRFEQIFEKVGLCHASSSLVPVDSSATILSIT
jgi:glycosyltransferase involved in cell wall biosynthesis